MNVATLPRKVAHGLPYLGKELRAIVSDRTPLFIAVPRTVHIWRGAPCNAKCIMCTYGYLKGEAYRGISTSAFTDEMMPRALDQIHELCGRGTLVSYMGGEPTINRHIMKWIDQAGRLGLDFRFTTNGYSMTEEMANRFVSSGGLFNVGISLESLNATINEDLRPMKNGTAKTVRCIELLLEAREKQKRHISLNIKTVLTDLNLESFGEIVRRYGKVEGVMCTPQMFERLEDMPEATLEKCRIKDLARLEKTTEEIRQLKRDGYTVHITDQGLSEMIKQYKDNTDLSATMHKKKLKMDDSEPECNIGTDSMWIEAGLVKLCPYHPPIGNFVTDTHVTLKQMWHSEVTKRVRAQTRACRRLCTISCLRRTPISHKVSTFLKIG